MVWLWVVLAFLLLAGVLFIRVWAQYRQIRKRMPKAVFRTVPRASAPETWSNHAVTVCWVGHSTLFINLYGTRILTDPVFSKRVGVSAAGIKIGVKRHTSPALNLEDVAGHVDLILLSHAHLDHFDVPTLRRLADGHAEVVTAPGTGRLLKRMNFSRVVELEENQSVMMAGDISIKAIPVRHWGARFPWNQSYGWTGYLLEHRDGRVFFAGDTAYTPAFADLAGDGPIDIACIPIGAYAPDSFQGAHCTPEQAWKMFLECGAKWLVPIHWDTFVLSEEPIQEPLERLLHAAGLEAERVVIRRHGEIFVMPEVPHTT